MPRKKAPDDVSDIGRALGCFGTERRVRMGPGKFKVLIEEVVQYVVEVEADSRDAAGRAAMDVLKTADDCAQYRHAVSEREVAHVYAGDKPLPKTTC
jgi:hypothetical protein